MTIKKGDSWGVPFVVPVETRDVDSDYELAQGSRNDIHIVKSGDIFEVLGQPRTPAINEMRTLIEIDALFCTVTTEHGKIDLIASSSITIGRWRTLPWSHERFICVTNGGLYEKRNIAPRAHPNDGALDIVEISAEMPWRQRTQAYQRATTGNHLPHPFISASRATTFDCTRRNSRERLHIDSQLITQWQAIRVQIVPDYWKVIV